MENEFLDSDEVSSKLLELEDRCCHNNLCIDSVQETPKEIWDLCKEKIQSMIINTKYD